MDDDIEVEYQCHSTKRKSIPTRSTCWHHHQHKIYTTITLHENKVEGKSTNLSNYGLYFHPVSMLIIVHCLPTQVLQALWSVIEYYLPAELSPRHKGIIGGFLTVSKIEKSTVSWSLAEAKSTTTHLCWCISIWIYGYFFTLLCTSNLTLCSRWKVLHPFLQMNAMKIYSAYKK